MKQEELKKLLSYEPETGIFKWKRNTKGIKTGALAGGACGMHKLNYIKANAVRYRADKLAILYMTGVMPRHVDHLDGDRKNDTYKNLAPRENKPRYVLKTPAIKDPRNPLIKKLDNLWVTS